MDQHFDFTQFLLRFPDEAACLEEIKKRKFPYGIFCKYCRTITKHYRIKKKSAYSCLYCRHQVYPLSGTLFEKSSTPLRIWFLAMFLMTHTRGIITKKQLQRELGVTYKTAWRVHNLLFKLMEQNNGDLLKGTSQLIPGEYRERRRTFINKLEIKVVHKQESEEEEP